MTQQDRGLASTETVHRALPDAPRSNAAVFGHPIHPVLIPFPIAFLVGMLGADLAYLATQDEFWARAAYVLLVAGLVTGVLAGIAGAVDYFTIERARTEPSGRYHALGNAAVLVLAVVSLLLRVGDMEGAIVPWGLVLSAVIAALLTITGWLGGELSYRHLVGVNPKRTTRSDVHHE